MEPEGAAVTETEALACIAAACGDHPETDDEHWIPVGRLRAILARVQPVHTTAEDVFTTTDAALFVEMNGGGKLADRLRDLANRLEG